MGKIVNDFFQKLESTEEKDEAINEADVMKTFFGDNLNPNIYKLLEIRSKHTCDISIGPIEIADTKWVWYETNLSDFDNLYENALNSGEPIQFISILFGLIAIGSDSSGNLLFVEPDGRDVFLSGHESMFQIVKIADNFESFIKMNYCYDLVNSGEYDEAKIIAEEVRPFVIDKSEHPHDIYTDYNGTIEELTGKTSPEPGTETNELWNRMEWLFTPLYFASGIDGFRPAILPSKSDLVPETISDLWISAIHNNSEETTEILKSYKGKKSGLEIQAIKYLGELNEEMKILPGELTLQQMRNKLKG